MNTKNIALSIGGVLAILALGYFFYQRQETTTTAAPETNSDVAVTGSYAYVPSPSIDVPSLTTEQSGIDSNTSHFTPTDSSDMLTGILNQFASTLQSNESDFSNTLTTLQHSAQATPVSQTTITDSGFIHVAPSVPKAAINLPLTS